MDIASQLKYRAELYEPETFENDMGENDRRMARAERFWCGVVPHTGKVDSSIKGIEIEEVTHKITIRMGASKRLRRPGGRQHTRLLIDGVWYDVMYCLPQYSTRDRILVYAKVRAE
ncbi:MAG: head-tail adaptor protein [Eubacteriales bacterium]|nr:head-tail adaptor protein [Eubacteriales bacterium]